MDGRIDELGSAWKQVGENAQATGNKQVEVIAQQKPDILDIAESDVKDPPPGDIQDGLPPTGKRQPMADLQSALALMAQQPSSLPYASQAPAARGNGKYRNTSTEEHLDLVEGRNTYSQENIGATARELQARAGGPAALSTEEALANGKYENTSTEELLDRLVKGRSTYSREDIGAMARELQARAGGPAALSTEEASAIDRLITGRATQADIALLRSALSDAVLGNRTSGEITDADFPPGQGLTQSADPKDGPRPAGRSGPAEDARMPDLPAAPARMPTRSQPARENYRYLLTVDLVNNLTINRARFKPVELGFMMRELQVRAAYIKDDLPAERRKWLGQISWGNLSDEDAVRLGTLLPRTGIEILHLLTIRKRELSPGNFFASMELVAHGAFGGWMTGHSLASCRGIIKKLLLTRIRGRRRAITGNHETAIDAFIAAIGPGRDASREWHEVAQLLPESSPRR